MRCNDARQLLEAYVDDELDSGAAGAFERHLAECPSCTRTLEARRALRQAIATADLRHHLPGDARVRLREAISSAATPTGSDARFGVPWRGLVAAAAMVVIAVGGFVLGRQWPRETTAQLADAAVSSHVRSLLAGRPEDVLSSDHHAVKPWFTGKLDFAPEVIELPADGLHLSGGRLDDVAGRRVAALVYHAGAHRISLFTWPQPGSGCDEPGPPLIRRGFRVLTWSCDAMAYVAVSDASEGTLRELARGVNTAVSAGD